MSGYTKAWLAWAGAFAAIEARALASGESGHTLSGHVWRWFGVRDQRGAHLMGMVKRAVLLTFLAWLTAHLAFGVLSPTWG